MKKENKVEQNIDKKPVEVNTKNSQDIQIHFGNVKLIEIKLLETINKQLSEILILMREQVKK